MLQIHVQPGIALKHAKEGTETSAFWFAVGGKQSHTSKKATNDIVRDPHLFTFSFNRGSISRNKTSLYEIVLEISIFIDWYLVFLTIINIFLYFFCNMDVPGKLQVSVTLWTFTLLLGYLSEMRQWLWGSCILNPFLYFALQEEEVYNFSQDDLLTEDILILDTHAEVFVWIGQSVDTKEKQNAFEIAQVNTLNRSELLSPIFPFTSCT